MPAENDHYRFDDDVAPVSLYLDLAEGHSADLEVVARASLAFAAAIKDAAFRYDPSADVRVELVSGTEGSLSLNALIRNVRKTVTERPIAAAIAMGTLGWFGGYTGTELLDEARDARVEITDEQMDEIARRTADEIMTRQANPRAAEVYRELSQDPAIQGVGASMRPDRKPRHIVPREEFPERSRADFALIPTIIDEPKRRTRQRRMTVIVISPVLLRGDRRWKLRSYEGEFGAAMRDQAFARDLLSGARTLPTVEGVQLDAMIETIDVWAGTTWMAAEHNVLQVFDIIPPARQSELELVRPKQSKRRPGKKGKPDKK